MAGNVQNIKIKPMTVFLGEDLMQVQKITCVADVTSSLQNKYFLFMDAAGAKHYAWINVAAAGADPAPAGGWTPHVVAIAANASATTIATALQTMLTAVTGFTATVSGAVVTLSSSAIGYAQPARDGLAPTTFAFEVTTIGDAEVDAGYTDGEIELSGLSKTKEEIFAHQTGKVALGEIITGYDKPELGITFKETSKSKLRDLIIRCGSSTYTPEGVGKVEVVGYGPELVGKSTPTKRVRLHPIALGTADKSEDFVFWKGGLDIEKFNFSGESFSVVPAKIAIYPDSTKKSNAQYFVIGDPANI